MKAWQIITVSFISIVLFFSLVIFGIAFTVNQVVLNPDYIVARINDVDFTEATREMLEEQDSEGNIPAETQTLIIDTVDAVEPVIKERVALLFEETFDYLKNSSSTKDVKEILGDSVMDSDFVADILQEIDLSELMQEATKEQGGSMGDIPVEFKEAVIDAVDKSEASLKLQIANASDQIFDYLLGQTSSLDLRTTLRQTVLSDDFVSEIIGNLDYLEMIRDILSEDVGQQLPEGITLSDAQIDDIAAALEPDFEAAMIDAAGAFADYLLGITPDLSIEADISAAQPAIKEVVKEAYMAQLPGGVEDLPQSQIDAAFEDYYEDFKDTIPDVYRIQSNDLGMDIAADFSEALMTVEDNLADARDGIDEASHEVETRLDEARTYIGYFRTGFILLIVFIVLLIAGIVLINRNVKYSCIPLGIVFFLYGAFTFAGALIAKGFARQQFAEIEDIPRAVNDMPETMLNYAVSPVQTVGIVCLVLGVLLIAASIVYPRLRPAGEE